MAKKQHKRWNIHLRTNQSGLSQAGIAKVGEPEAVIWLSVYGRKEAVTEYAKAEIAHRTEPEDD